MKGVLVWHAFLLLMMKWKCVTSLSSSWRKEHEIEVAQNGVQARDALQEYFHLVLLDLKLPDTNGITLLKEIKIGIQLLRLC